MSLIQKLKDKRTQKQIKSMIDNECEYMGKGN